MTLVSARKVWERQGLGGKLLWVSLLPASFLYSMVMQMRNALYTRGWIKSRGLRRPVVSVGNLTVGGTGKTPTCLWLAKELAGRGLRVGILSRGYRRKEAAPLVLQPNGESVTAVEDNDIIKAGDEPLMMARLYGQTVGVCKDRFDAASEMLRKVNVDVFILDDGFQHRRVKRNVDVLLLGADASGWVLPAGPFREPRRNFRRADFLLSTAGNGAWNSVMARGRANASFEAALRPVALIGVGARGCKEFPLTLLYRSKILTVTGVADPRGLYRLIHEWEGEIVETLEFPDHHCYTARDWQQINRMGRLVDLIITTEKDILKLARFPFAKDKLLALRVAMTVENGSALVGAIVEKIEQARDAN
ncbi:MAG TPA: tetraacyldisaccharide 4'-kinase [Verrucomicrobiae bacterium]|nr:tetraacyldisaccharide 4'-kinase [Verrucomicrobiae bacterium]